MYTLSSTHVRRGFVCGMLALLLAASAIACGSDGDDDAATVQTSPADTFTIWVPTVLQRPFERIINQFQHDNPDVTVEALYETGAELNDRLLLGERPDAYVSTARQVDTLADDATFSKDWIDVAADAGVIVVKPGNPRVIGDVTVFGSDPSIAVGLCSTDVSCGRMARTVLASVGITPAPDETLPHAKAVIDQVASGTLDAGIVYHSQAAKPARDGMVEIVEIPSGTNVENLYRIAIGHPGPALDRFVAWLETAPEVDRILAGRGLIAVPRERSTSG